MKKILLIDNTFDPPHGCPEIQDNLSIAAKSYGPIEIVVARAPEGKIPTDLDAFDGAVLSGSKTRILESAPWIDSEMQAIKNLHRLKIPTLGICYGEQLIARTLLGANKAGVAPKYELGWVEVNKIKESPILEGLSEKFVSFGYHLDEVHEVSHPLVVTAASVRCPVQAYEVVDAPMWGVQFHPERGLDEGNRGLDRRYKADPTLEILNRDKADKMYDPSVGLKIFSNFLRLVWAKKA